MKSRLFLLAFVALLGFGCNGGSTQTSTGSTGSTAPKGSKTPEVQEPAKPASADLPASLKHEGYEWYGLGSGKTLNVKLNQAGMSRSGSQSFTLEKVEGESAIFKQNWTGDLALQGDIRLKLDPKGVYGTEAQGQKLNPPELEMPAKPTPGYKWQSKAKLDLGTGSVENTVSTVVGIKPIKVAGRDVQALIIRRVSDLVDSSGKRRMEATEYYERNVGSVKLEVKITGGKLPPQSFSMEATP